MSSRRARCSVEPGPGATVLHAGVPLSAAGRDSVVETWDTLGMRGTASHDLVFEDVFVPAEKVAGTRPYGELVGPLLVAAIHFAPLAGAAYLGVAAGACDEAVRLAKPGAARQVGEMRSRLRVALWALLAAVDEIGEDPAADEATLETVMLAKRHAVNEARAVVDIALEVAGGSAFFRGSPMERAYREGGGAFHQLMHRRHPGLVEPPGPEPLREVVRLQEHLHGTGPPASSAARSNSASSAAFATSCGAAPATSQSASVTASAAVLPASKLAVRPG